MTEKEAIKIRSAFANGYEYPFGNGFRENCDTVEVSRHADLLNNAIKKQIPKKAQIERHRGFRYYFCPECHCHLQEWGAYCPCCGQRINKEDEK